MDVGAIPVRSPEAPEPPLQPVTHSAPISPAASALIKDALTPSLQNLANPQIAQLLEHLEQARQAHDPSLLDNLIKTAVAAVSARDFPHALAAISELVNLHPEHGAQLVHAEISFAPIRAEVDALLQHLTLTARSSAEHTLAAASRVIEHIGSPRLGELNPRDVLAVASRFFEAGTHINYVRAGELGQTILAYYPVLLPDVHLTPPRPVAAKPDRPPLLQRLKISWKRVPVLVLLTAWLLIGLIGGIISLILRYAERATLSPLFFEFWSAGFLVLVVVQFLATTRNTRL